MEQLIRFDWAIKKLLRTKANADILEGFLTAMLNEDVTVKSILESESNQEDEADKFNRVDLLAENAKNELILIEVRVRSEYDFFHRVAYGAAKLLTEHMQKGQPYRDIRKVISVSITYFNLGLGTDYLYHGTTDFVGVHTRDTLTLTDAQHSLFGVREVRKIFPEYYLIRVGRFPDEVHDALDEWIYMLKHSEVRPEFGAKNIQKASEKLRIMNLDEHQRKAYDRYLDNLSYHKSVLWFSREEGRQEERLAVARKALDQGLDIQTISALTGLTHEDILKQ